MVQPLDDITDFELIRRMAGEDVDPACAREAWGVFYLRHRDNLFSICMWHYEYLLGAEGVKDLVQDALMRAYDRASTFNHAEICDGDGQQRKCRRWLARIAENLVRDTYKNQPKVTLADDGSLDDIAAVAGESSGGNGIPDSKRLSLLKAAFDSLSETEQTVLRTTMFWWQPDQQHQRMPNRAMEQLSRQIGKSPDNIRQIRLRALRKLKDDVNDRLNNEKVN